MLSIIEYRIFIERYRRNYGMCHCSLKMPALCHSQGESHVNSPTECWQTYRFVAVLLCHYCRHCFYL